MSKKFNVFSMGTMAIDKVVRLNTLPKEDSFALIENEEDIPGGSSSNMSIALKQLGVEVYQSGQIGDDIYGNLLIEDFKLEQIDYKYIYKKIGGTTLHNYIFVDRMGNHSIVANLGDSINTLDPSNYPEYVLDNIDILYLDLFSPKAAIYLAKKAKEKNITVVFNLQCPLSLMELVGVSIEEFYELLSLTDLFICGKAGAENLFTEINLELSIKRFYEKYKNNNNLKLGWIYTSGEDGSYWYDGKSIIKEPIHKVKVVDTTGAGDAYIAGIIYSHLYLDYSKIDSMKFASVTAAIKVGQTGPRLKTNVKEILNTLKIKK